MPSQLPFMNQNSIGGQAMVSQPIYTFGRITHGIHAAEEGVQAHQAEVNRTELDVKMNVADLYVAVLRTARLGEAAESKVVSLTAHNKNVTGFFENGVVSKNDLLAA
jgi:outer membrane protein TolC